MCECDLLGGNAEATMNYIRVLDTLYPPMQYHDWSHPAAIAFEEAC